MPNGRHLPNANFSIIKFDYKKFMSNHMENVEIGSTLLLLLYLVFVIWSIKSNFKWYQWFWKWKKPQIF